MGTVITQLFAMFSPTVWILLIVVVGLVAVLAVLSEVSLQSPDETYGFTLQCGVMKMTDLAVGQPRNSSNDRGSKGSGILVTERLKLKFKMHLDIISGDFSQIQHFC